MLVLISIFAIIPSYNHDEPIPSWIKKVTKMWHDEEISDNEFINCIRWSVEEKIILMKYLVLNNGSTHEVPTELRNIAYFWSTGKISDSDFTSTLRYMIKNGIIKLNDDDITNMSHEITKASVANETQKSIVIVPVLTSSAYSEHGFYAHYRGECDKKCLTVPIRDYIHSSTDSANGVRVLQSLGYKTITDIDIDRNPQILSQYDKVIVLHNEYVTQREFDAITRHPHVMYLYPNALYAKVSVDYWNNAVTLIRGHGFPNSTISNGFGWKFDNSKLEYDRECNNWRFDEISNGIMLRCYPEGRLDYDITLLETIKNF